MAGAGHNGLVAACYLARAGWNVTVLERQAEIGGATSTEERLPGYRFDTHSVAHNIINMGDVIEDLALEACGLEYQPMDPFATMLTPDGQAVRFYRDLNRTCAEIARHDPAEAVRYRAFIRRYDPLVRAGAAFFRRRPTLELRAALPGVVRWLRADGPWAAAAGLLGSYGRLLDSCCELDWMKGALAALAAHATVGPDTPGGAFYVMWQAAYHRYGMWHARGGSGALAAALHRRLESLGGQVLTNHEVTAIDVHDGAVRGVIAAGRHIPAEAVITTVNPRTVLLEWVSAETTPAGLRRRLAAARSPNAVQFVVHAAASRLPPYAGTETMPDAWNGMAALTRSLDQVSRAFGQAELGLIPEDPPVYLFTPSAIDATLAPPGKHTVYLACPAFPARLALGSWPDHAESAAQRLIDVVEPYAPGFRASLTAIRPYTPDEMTADLGCAHPMHLCLLPDQLLLMRPTPELAHHRTPIRGLYLSGAGTAPTGGVSGIPGRRAAQALLKDLGRS